MGVPAFYRWLSDKYPKIVEDVLEDRVHLVHNSGSIRQPFDCLKPNPSGLECDNFYIDMNGIIHPCSHPEHGPQPTTEEEMYENVCRYVDRLFRTVRPRKLLFLAIDGVAPRAKMNQQRSRRFRAAQEAAEKKELEMEITQSLIEAGHALKPISPNDQTVWDSNVITPGTKFMIHLSEYIRFYIRKRISTDPAWKQITVIFSDASVPGEGEHKIMAHVRQQRGQPNFNPNLVHILHGLDADLIMLALATHEAHFYILREEVLFGRRGAEDAERKRTESGFADRQRLLDEAAGGEAMELLENKTKPLQRVSVPILREYLAFEFQECNNVPFREVSFERLIDDIVFLCFFVGNDFLPHLPSLDIRDGALDFLFNVYKRVLPTLGDYITNHGGQVNLSHVDVILAEVGNIEDYVFGMKHQNEQKDKNRRKQYQQRKKHLTKDGSAPLAFHPGNNGVGGVASENLPKARGRAARILGGDVANKEKMTVLGNKSKAGKKNATGPGSNADAAEKLRSSLANNENENGNDNDNSNTPEKRMTGSDDDGNSGTSGEKETANTKDDNDDKDTEVKDKESDEEAEFEPEFDPTKNAEAKKVLSQKVKEVEQKKLKNYAENVVDKVRLHEKGWKNRYYTDKCKADDVAEHGGKEHLFRSYVMGLCWVMKYYYEGCPSWKWFYPFHYAPFASDLKNIERFNKECTSFEIGVPFKPVEQLMAVLPEHSSHAIPTPARWLMRDPVSPIIDFYPKDIHCDPNGKAMPWLWVVLLPFIDEERLLDNLEITEGKWSVYEKLCNARGLDDGYIYCHVTHPMSATLTPVLDDGNAHEKIKIEGELIFGKLRPPLRSEIYPLDQKSSIPPPPTSHKIKSENVDELLSSPIDINAALCAAFTEPEKDVHKSVLLPGALAPNPVLQPQDFQIRRPRLNRGGGTIANMGATRAANSYQPGYGSMNINNYERQLAEKSGRGHQLDQTGTRAWGAMEPRNKRQRHDGQGYGNNQPNQHQNQHQYGSNPFQQPTGYNNRNQGQGNFQGGGGRSDYPQHSNNSRNDMNARWQPRNGPPPQPATRQLHWQPPQQQQQNRHHQQPPPPRYNQQQNYQQQQQQQPPRRGQNQPRQGYSFNNHQPSNDRRHGGQSHQQQPRQGDQQRSGISASVMSNLRSQLKGTLNKNRNSNNRDRR